MQFVTSGMQFLTSGMQFLTSGMQFLTSGMQFLTYDALAVRTYKNCFQVVEELTFRIIHVPLCRVS
jgi:hypothetical protein